MRYTVQTTDGEMEYGSLEQLRQAVEFGLVGPDDLVTEEGQSGARPANRIVRPPASGASSEREAIARPRARNRGRAVWLFIAAGAVVLAYFELPRWTVVYPQLWNLPGLSWLMRRPEAGGAVVLPAWIPAPAGLGWVDVAAAGVVLLVLAFGLWRAPLRAGAPFAAAAAYFVVTDRWVVGSLLIASAVGLLVRGVAALRARRAR